MARACAYPYARLLPARHALGEAGTCLAAQASLLSRGHGPSRWPSATPLKPP